MYCQICEAWSNKFRSAGVAHPVERHLAKVEVASSSLVTRSKKEVTFVYQKLLLFLSKPQAWCIITARSVVHIISPFGAVSHHGKAVYKSSCGLMRCNTSC